jgi:hypothetical protein
MMGVMNMKTIIKYSLLGTTAILLSMIDMQPQPSRMSLGYTMPLGLQLVQEAEAVMGRQRRTRRRGLAVGYSAGKASGAAAATAATSAAAAPAPAPAPAPTPAAQPAGALPIGTIVAALPDGCTTITMSGVQYNKCGSDYYRAAFQGNSLVYMVTQP